MKVLIENRSASPLMLESFGVEVPVGGQHEVESAAVGEEIYGLRNRGLVAIIPVLPTKVKDAPKKLETKDKVE